jgi:hypothetical protein
MRFTNLIKAHFLNGHYARGFYTTVETVYMA